MKGSIKKDKKTGKYSFVVDIGKDATGKRKQKMKRGFSTKAEAEKELAKLINETNEGIYFEPQKMTVDEFFEMWFKERKSSVERTTYNNQLAFYKIYITPRMGSLKMYEVTPIFLQNYVNDLMEYTTLKASTIHKLFDVLKVSFKKAVKLKIIKENPSYLVDLPKIKKTEMNVWDIKEVNFFLEEVSNVKRPSNYLTAYLLAILTGCRQGEILGLRWRDIDFENKFIYIKQTLSHDGKELRNAAKTKASIRSISIPDILIKQLKKERKTCLKNKLKCGSVYEDHDLVICTKHGRPVQSSNLIRGFKKDVKKVGLPVIRFHDLRHTHATMLISQNINPKIISERLGHARIGITLDIYSHVLPSMQQEVAAKLDEIIKNI
ncbi:site-specific integrase [Bacillus sp. ISL-7]|uniref:site-specific integrase n=1 Tax=Bacillus sp. ISL-7 TaxID=2819136 RepID=UPI001BE4EAB9|nr:site-specific integrase [Bacillus sp. ISL-7]MBT2736190.1 site-specific integrase [Bacillus sp. ISL-7]